MGTNTLNCTAFCGGTLCSLVGDVGGQVVNLYGANSVVYAIEIGTLRYGGAGGGTTPQGTLTLPDDGVFTLYGMQGIYNGPLHYLKIGVNGTIITAGSQADGNVWLDLGATGMQVKFKAIEYTTGQINGVQFELVS